MCVNIEEPLVARTTPLNTESMMKNKIKTKSRQTSCFCPATNNHGVFNFKETVATTQYTFALTYDILSSTPMRLERASGLSSPSQAPESGPNFLRFRLAQLPSSEGVMI